VSLHGGEHRTESSGVQTMMGLHAFVYAHFMPSCEIFATDSIEAAKALLRQRYPNSHCGEWQQAPHGVNLPLWPGVAAQLRFELGETEDKHKPLAYVVVSALRLRVPRAAEARE